MRPDLLTMCLILVAATGGCTAPLGTAPDAGSGGSGGGAGGSAGGGGAGGTSGGGAFCSTALGANCSASPLQIAATVCTLDMGIAAACGPCGPQDAGGGCILKGALVRGATHTYVQIMNVDVAYVYVYDQNQRLVAKLFWSVNAKASGGSGWSCTAGPADFDPTEAMSDLPVVGPGELTGMCAS
jgi:hypothetical protein